LLVTTNLLTAKLRVGVGNFAKGGVGFGHFTSDSATLAMSQLWEQSIAASTKPFQEDNYLEPEVRHLHGLRENVIG